ncbi:MAG TPA: hypothetical protein VGB85_13250 [Nannocystis sp.]
MNVDVLAQACAREARSLVADRDASLAWAGAAIACYARTSRRRSAGFDRQGSEVPLFGLICLMISRWGPETGSEARDPAPVIEWVQQGIDILVDPQIFRASLADAGSERREHAVLLEERLEIARSLHALGLLPSSMIPWLHSAGLF